MEVNASDRMLRRVTRVASKAGQGPYVKNPRLCRGIVIAGYFYCFVVISVGVAACIVRGCFYCFVVILESCSPGSVVIKIRKTTDSGQKPSRMTLNFINGRISCDNNSKVSSFLYLGYLFLVHTRRVLIWAYWFCFTVILGWWSHCPWVFLLFCRHPGKL